MSSSPALVGLSLGAGVQSTTLLILSAEGVLPKIDFAAFADTRFEPRAVYEHLDRLEREVARPAGIEIVRVTAGDIRDDAVNPDAEHYAQMPLHIRGNNGGAFMMRRACTAHYKVRPLKAEVRRRLGYPYPAAVPAGVFAQQWIGISTDEASRARFSDVDYIRHEFPLMLLKGGGSHYVGWTRQDCQRFLESRGFGNTPKSACVTCPYSGNRRLRLLRDTCRCGHHREVHTRFNGRQDQACAHLTSRGREAEPCGCGGFDNPDWRDAVDFDAAIRHGYARAVARGSALHGEAFVHRSLVPLDQAPIDHVTRAEWKERQTTLFEPREDDERGCSPWSCRGEDDDD
ncbi:hypothetical protein [Streptacidiphilus anmyonensis]|uniref:hypothetical protein n=1 Tax=Streptacidiphilus anmyonensis TaxID=405782 RepID=UPI0005AB0489|nr:hypothetical protein [Streptacidiphilus anmyonensis]